MRDETADMTVSTDRRLLDVDVVFEYLNKRSYLSKGIPRDVVERSIEHSLCFGLYREKPDRKQVGFARVVTDHATFAWLCDVFVLEEYRGRGLGKLLVQA